MRFLPLIVSCTLLAGCFNYNTYYKSGQTIKEVKSAETHCDVKALEQVPQEIVRELEPIYGAYDSKLKRRPIVGYQTITYDENKGLRERVAKQCMIDQGFYRVEIPFCDKDQLNGQQYNPVAKLPKHPENLCVLRLENRKRVIISLNQSLP